MGRKPIGEKPLTKAERQAAWKVRQKGMRDVGDDSLAALGKALAVSHLPSPPEDEDDILFSPPARAAYEPISQLGVWRGLFVVKYRLHKGNWPDGPGAWYKDEDWDKDGNLIAAGEARLRALDPFANDRAAGLPCPPLGEVDRRIDQDLARGEAGADHRLGRE
jgi:hypothetical protein